MLVEVSAAGVIKLKLSNFLAETSIE